jgi:alanyl-tRNA synthetase
MKTYTSHEIRKKFLDYYKKQEHAIIASASVVPENDPTALFNSAGMQPLVPYLLGEKHPEGVRLANSQKCIRTIDLEEVGDDTHLTFFEMLGNWSLGDYFKKEAIVWSFEFLTSEEWMGIPINRLAITVFEGDENAPADEFSANEWHQHGIPKDRISYMPVKDNWWGPVGETGPCGPDTEMFYWVGEGEPPIGSNVKNDEYNWMEIGNDVFMEYIKDEQGNYNQAAQQNVDTGAGLERMTTVLNLEKSVYDTDIFAEVLDHIQNLTGKQYQKGVVINEINFHDKDETIQTVKNMRIIADHARTATILISDGIVPSNVDQGYILRRLIRRAIRSSHKLGVEQNFLAEIAKVVISKFEDVYSNIKNNADKILEEITKEEKQFRKTLKQGLKEFSKLMRGFQIAFERSGKKITRISGDKAFKLYDTYGFPIEMTEELARENELEVDREGFEKAYTKHQEKSRAGSAQKFKGGLADNSEQVKKYHTATHLLHQALRDVLGDSVAQKGSNLTADRLRFDFSHHQKMTPEEKQKVEEIINQQIQKGLAISFTEMTVEKALEQGAIGLFGDRYEEKVKVYKIGDYAKEICGGPHVENTNIMGHFKIKKEEASSAGVRRIRGILINET